MGVFTVSRHTWESFMNNETGFQELVGFGQVEKKYIGVGKPESLTFIGL